MIKNIWNRFNPYLNLRIMAIFLLGVSSGLPLLLILSTLSVWLQKEGISKTTIGLFSFTTIPYALKFIIAPFIEYLNPPFFKYLGHRRGWIIFSQTGLFFSILNLGFSEPNNNLFYTALCAITVAIFSTIQDINYESYRTDISKDKLGGYYIGASVIGYRAGMLISSAGAIYLEIYFNWKTSYLIMAFCMFIGILTSILYLQNEKKIHTPYIYKKNKLSCSFILIPIKNLIQKNNIIFVFLFITSYKFGDSTTNVMTIPFLLEMGFSEIEIAHIAKSFGIVAIMLGSLLGGILLSHKTLKYNLLLCSITHIITNIMFLYMYYLGCNILFFCLIMWVQNFICGLSQTTLIYYLSQFCNKPFTTTHYAILSSYGSWIRIILSFISGWIADHVTWEYFYNYVIIGCIPCIIFIYIYSKKIFNTKV